MKYGTYCSRIDQKLRILIPAEVRACIPSQTIIICLNAHQQLKLMTYENLKNASELLFELCTTTLDQQGRISIPHSTRNIFPEVFSELKEKGKTFFHVNVNGTFIYFTKDSLMQSFTCKTSE